MDQVSGSTYSILRVLIRETTRRDSRVRTLIIWASDTCRADTIEGAAGSRRVCSSETIALEANAGLRTAIGTNGFPPCHEQVKVCILRSSCSVLHAEPLNNDTVARSHSSVPPFRVLSRALCFRVCMFLQGSTCYDCKRLGMSWFGTSDVSMVVCLKRTRADPSSIRERHKGYPGV